MDVARAIPETSPDIGRAGAVGETPAVTPSADVAAVSKNSQASTQARRDEPGSPTPTLETLRESFRDALEMANERLNDRGASINISVDPSTKTVIVQVTDRETGDTVRQIPPESALQVSRNIERLTGILVDRKV
jgi:flagellar protein FlaG